MKVAFVKYKYDVFGPWSTILWEDTSPIDLFNIWPSKVALWEMSCLLEADWYVVSEANLKSDYLKGSLKDSRRVKIVDKYVKKVISQYKIPYERYDIVISLDPILDVPEISNTLFGYFLNEHWDRLYYRSLKKPLNKYDLFLAHMLDAKSELTNLCQAVSFPYLYSQEVARNIFGLKKEEKVWVDWRTLTTLSQTETWKKETEEAAKRLQYYLSYPVFHKGDFNKKPLGISDPPLWGDAYNYLKEMAKCKYYIGVGRLGGAGQALCDAASLECICIGDMARPYHRLVCHPELLCKDLFDLVGKFKKVLNSFSLQNEAIIYQQQALKRYFFEEPFKIFEKAIMLKKDKLYAKR